MSQSRTDTVVVPATQRLTDSLHRDTVGSGILALREGVDSELWHTARLAMSAGVRGLVLLEAFACSVSRANRSELGLIAEYVDVKA